MPTPAKQQAIDELNDVFRRAKSAVLANYQGIPANELTAFRAEMKRRSLDFRIGHQPARTKNLTQLADRTHHVGSGHDPVEIHPSILYFFGQIIATLVKMLKEPL